MYATTHTHNKRMKGVNLAPITLGKIINFEMICTHNTETTK